MVRCIFSSSCQGISEMLVQMSFQEYRYKDADIEIEKCFTIEVKIW